MKVQTNAKAQDPVSTKPQTSQLSIRTLAMNEGLSEMGPFPWQPGAEAGILSATLREKKQK